MNEIPRYRCHKEVRALKIEGIRPLASGKFLIVPEDHSFPMFEVAAAYVEKHKPQSGGYYVLYEDDYESWSPAKAFEEGYTRISPTTQDGKPWAA